MPDHAWLFSTDADTRVSPSWIIDGLQLAATTGAQLITATVDLDPRGPDPGVIDLHRDIIRNGTNPDGTHPARHAYVQRGAALIGRISSWLRPRGR